jgi:hypothetical protein
VRNPFATRFAPSPNGDLHLGHALSAITGYELARSRGGRFLLRVEDIDLERSSKEYVSRIFDDLHWLGLQWEEPVLHQSSRFGAYRAATAVLLDHDLLYPCFATRGDIEAAVATARSWGSDPDGAPLYPGLYRNVTAKEGFHRIEAGQPYCLRINMDRALEAAASILDGEPLTFCEWNGESATNPTVVAADLGRCGHRAQRYSGKLSSGRSPRRCRARHHGCDARPGSVCRHRLAPVTPSPARSARTGLSSPPPDPRPHGTQALKNTARYDPSNSASGGRNPGRYSPLDRLSRRNRLTTGLSPSQWRSRFAMVRPSLTR